jgi:hypothetical protein
MRIARRAVAVVLLGAASGCLPTTGPDTEPDTGPVPETPESPPAAPTPVPAPAVHGFQVAPAADGSDTSVGGDGSAEHPWTLAAALAHPSAVQPGDTIWVQAGTYRGVFRSRLTGTPDRPIVVRAQPDARATIDGRLVVTSGSDAWFWGLEITSSELAPGNEEGVRLGAPRVRLVNLVVHDHGGDGIGAWSQAPDAEVYGSLVYGNGRQVVVPGYAHGIYVQNDAGQKLIADNVVFGQYGFGIHAYAEGGRLRDLRIAGNVAFANGIDGLQADLFVGSIQPAERISVDSNAVMHGNARTSVWVGYRYGGTQSTGIVVRGNYVVGGGPSLRLEAIDDLVLGGNTLVGSGSSGGLVETFGPTGGWTWDSNEFFGRSRSAEFGTATGGDLTFLQWMSATGLGLRDSYVNGTPTGTHVIVRPNRYEAGRALVVVYDWTGAAGVDVPLADVLRFGDAFTVRDVRDFYGPPIATGAYVGDPVRIPLPVARLQTVSGTVVPLAGNASTFAAFIVTSSTR